MLLLCCWLLQDAGFCAWLSLHNQLPSAVQHRSIALQSDCHPETLQSGERIHSLNDLQDIDELHVLEVRHLPPQAPRGEASMKACCMAVLTIESEAE